jgi:hypothetical protein
LVVAVYVIRVAVVVLLTAAAPMAWHATRCPTPTRLRGCGGGR